MSLSPVVAVTAVLALLLGLIVFPLSRAALVAISVVLVTLSSTYLDRDGDGSSLISIGVRILALVVLLRLRWPVLGKPPAVKADNDAAKRNVWFAPMVLAGMFGYLVVATLPHGELQAFVLYSAGAGIALGYGMAISRYADADDVLNGVVNGLFAVVLFSFGMLLVSPGDAILQGRLRGITSNPNFLGFYCAIALALLAFSKRNTLFVTVASSSCLAALVWTASRASLLVIVITAIGWLVMRETAAGKVLAAGAAGGAVVMVLAYPTLLSADDAAIFRTYNSRQGSWEYTTDVLAARPFSGVGFGHEAVQVASSPLRALVHAGYWGGLALAAMYVAILVLSWRAGRRATLFGSALVVHSLFEGWLLSPVGPMFLVFLAAWYGMAKRDGPDRSSDPEPLPSRAWSDIRAAR